MKAHIAVIIPAYNEEKTIGKVVEEVRSLGQEYQAVVVNDCSVDRTTDVAESSGATVIELPFNLGIGGAVQTGIRYAEARGLDMCVQVDGDGQHPPRQIPRLIEFLSAGQFDMVVGSRFLGGDYQVPAMRALGIRTLSVFLKCVSGLSIKDMTSGFRVFNRPVMELYSKYYPQDYPEPESLLFAYRKGFRVGEVPVDMQYREYGVSSITPFKSGYYMAKVLLAMSVDLFRKF
jgi:glycosyltransferase involved in cell wall biosynthesis